MSGMTLGHPSGGLWNWCAASRVASGPVRAAIAGALGRPVSGLDPVDAAGGPSAGAVLCDVSYVGGDFPTLIDCYLAPGDLPESTIASAVAVRLGVDLLLPDETLNPTRYVLAESNGTLRSVHVDETETDDGTERRHVRPCTGSDPACAAAPERDAA